MARENVQVLVPAQLAEERPTRNNWTVELNSAELATSCEQRAEYHSKRMKWWMKERDKTEKKVRESGLELREHQVTGGNQFHAVMDPELANRLSDTKRKVESHRQQLAEYTRWANFLKAMGDRPLAIGRDDFNYFQAKPPEAEGEE